VGTWDHKEKKSLTGSSNDCALRCFWYKRSKQNGKERGEGKPEKRRKVSKVRGGGEKGQPVPSGPKDHKMEKTTKDKGSATAKGKTGKKKETMKSGGSRMEEKGGGKGDECVWLYLKKEKEDARVSEKALDTQKPARTKPELEGIIKRPRPNGRTTCSPGNPRSWVLVKYPTTSRRLFSVFR